MTKIHAALDTRAVRVFVQAVRDGSFTLAGEHLNMSPSAVSKAINRLEKDLEARLLRRDPRSLSLTPDGIRFFKEAELLNAAIERARGAVARRSNHPQGKLRVTLPMNFGRTLVAPQLVRFSEHNPELHIEYLLTNGQLDPIENGIDVALWYSLGAWIDSRLVIEDIAKFGTVLCAAPAYLEQYGTPKKVVDLDYHRILNGVDERTGRHIPWNFHDGATAVNYNPKAAIVSNSLDLLLKMALDGGGIVYLPDYVADEAVRLGQLRVILPQYRLEPSLVQVVYPRSRACDQPVAAFVSLLKEILCMPKRNTTVARRTAGIA